MVDHDFFKLSIFSFAAYGETIPSNMLAGENMITDAIIDAILILLIFVCNATSKLSLISNVHQIRIADNKIINDKFSTLGFLSAIFHPV
jgi:hypothetical protein